ncbi:hypothetical protein ACPA9J_28070 [Pseudomonas aeruginosa]
MPDSRFAVEMRSSTCWTSSIAAAFRVGRPTAALPLDRRRRRALGGWMPRIRRLDAYQQDWRQRSRRSRRMLLGAVAAARPLQHPAGGVW